MRIRKSKQANNFTTLPNDLINDENISCDELGVMVYLLSKPDDWIVYRSQVAHRFGHGKDKMSRIFNVLIDLKYIVGGQMKDDNSGKYGGTEYIVYSEPKTEDGKPVNGIEITGVGKTDLGKPATTKERKIQKKDSYIDQEPELDLDPLKIEPLPIEVEVVVTRKKTPPKRKSQIAKDWAPSERNIQDARKQDFTDQEIQDEADKFRNYCEAHAKQYINWDAAWRQWVSSSFCSSGKVAIRKNAARNKKELTMVGVVLENKRNRESQNNIPTEDEFKPDWMEGHNNGLLTDR